MNIIYVLDAILSASQKSRYTGYIDLTRPDLPRIIHAVVAGGPKGVLNIPNTQKVRAYAHHGTTGYQETHNHKIDSE